MDVAAVASSGHDDDDDEEQGRRCPKPPNSSLRPGVCGDDDFVNRYRQ
jgi:hypothetical protein